MTTCKRCGETPDPDNLMRLLTSLERRLLDTECGYIELEQGLSVQEEEARKLREQVNSQSVQIEKLREQVTAPALRPDTVSGDAYRLLAEDCRRLERERDQLRAERDNYADESDTFRQVGNALRIGREDAQIAAAEYHAAWQDAAVYWKDKVARLEQELLLLGYDRVTAELNVDKARDFAQMCWDHHFSATQRYWLDKGQVPAWIRQATDAAD